MAVLNRRLYSSSDIYSYFVGCLCSYRGQANYIQGSDERALTLSSGVTVSFDDEELKFVPVTPGFYQVGTRAVFISRNPMRQWKKAFRPRGYEIRSMDNPQGRTPSSTVDHVEMYQSVIDGSYLSYDEAYRMLAEDRARSAALSKTVAIGFNPMEARFYVYVRSARPIRVGVPSSSGVVLFDQSSEFKETLEQAGVPINEN